MSAHSQNLSRREFLKISLLGGAALMFPPKLSSVFAQEFQQSARVLQGNTLSYQAADSNSWAENIYQKDEILNIKKSFLGEELNQNSLWYQLESGDCLHASSVQPVRTEVNQPRRYIPAWGLLAQVTIPFVETHVTFSHTALKAHRLYYASTHWVTRSEISVNGEVWYRIWDDLEEEEYYAPAHAFRIIPFSELTQISPEIATRDKTIIVSIPQQTLTAYERNELVFTARVSTGDKDANPLYATPSGTFTTFYKRPSRYMQAADSQSVTDFPGVPWVTYFTEDGYAFHGAYWHNSFGVPRSHGCVNLNPTAARWIYRWTNPAVRPDYRLSYNYENEGTQVLIKDS